MRQSEMIVTRIKEAAVLLFFLASCLFASAVHCDDACFLYDNGDLIASVVDENADVILAENVPVFVGNLWESTSTFRPLSVLITGFSGTGAIQITVWSDHEQNTEIGFGEVPHGTMQCITWYSGEGEIFSDGFESGDTSNWTVP